MQKILVCPDTHVPYHDKKAWRLFLKVAANWKPDVLVIIGDFADFYSVSFHSKAPSRKVSLRWEVERVNQELDRVGLLKIPKVVFIAGNHENRLNRYVAEHAEAFDNLVTIPALFKLKLRGWHYVDYKDFYKIGKLHFTHDLERAGKFAGYQTLADFGHNIVFGHTHRGSVVYQGTVHGEQHVALNVGWLGDPKQIDYGYKAKVARDWQQGFGTAVVDAKGDVFCRFHPIVNGKCEVDGTIFKC